MAFNSLTIGASTFNSIGSALYRLSTVAFGGLANDIKLSRGVRNKNGVTTASITRRIEKIITVDGVSKTVTMPISVNFTVPEGFTVAEASASLSDINTLCATSDFLSRLFMGES